MPRAAPPLRILSYKARYAGSTIFANCVLLVIQHLLTDFPALANALIMTGARPSETYIVGIPYSTNPRIVTQLKRQGFNVSAPSQYPIDEEVHAVLREAMARATEGGKKLLIIEDGGYAVPALSKDPALDDSVCIGAVEQTTRGKWRDEDVEREGLLRVPVISIPDCRLKNEFESHFVGEAVAANIRTLLQTARGETLANKVVTVVGFGAVGEKVADGLDKQGARIIAVDKDSLSLVRAALKGYEIKDMGEAARESFLIVGATGSTSIGRDVLLQVRHQTVLASASSGREEIAVQELDALSIRPPRVIKDVGRIFYTARGEIHLLADGYPVNFFRSDSVPNNVIDVILALLFEAAVQLARGDRAFPAKVLRGDEEVDENDIWGLYLRFST